MHKQLIWLTIAMVVSTATISTAGAADKKTFLGLLRPGQTLSLDEKAGRFELTILPGNVKLPMTVMEVHQDYVVLKDVSDAIELAIPTYSIKSIKTIRLPMIDAGPKER